MTEQSKFIRVECLKAPRRFARQRRREKIEIDDETCRLEPIDNPFGLKVLPMSPE